MAKRGSEGRNVRLRQSSIIFRSVYSQTGENIEGFALKVLPWGVHRVVELQRFHRDLSWWVVRSGQDTDANKRWLWGVSDHACKTSAPIPHVVHSSLRLIRRDPLPLFLLLLAPGPVLLLLALPLLLLPRRGRTVLLRRHELLPPGRLLLDLFLPLLLFPPFLRRPLHGLPAQEVFSAFDLQIDLALLLGRRERRVWFLALVRDLEGLLPFAQGSFLEVGQEAFPVLVSQLRVLHQFSLDLPLGY